MTPASEARLEVQAARHPLGDELKAEDRVIATWAIHEWLARTGTRGTLSFALDLITEWRRAEGVDGPLLQHEAAELCLRLLALALASLPIAPLG